MDPENFEQFELSADTVDEAAEYLKEGEELNLQFFDGRVINVELPKNLYLEVTYTEDVVKGDTTSSVLKDATLETGKVIKVPAFIKNWRYCECRYGNWRLPRTQKNSILFK